MEVVSVASESLLGVCSIYSKLSCSGQKIISNDVNTLILQATFPTLYGPFCLKVHFFLGSDHDEIDNTLKLLLGCCNLLMAPKSTFHFGSKYFPYIGAWEMCWTTHRSGNTLNTPEKGSLIRNLTCTLPLLFSLSILFILKSICSAWTAQPLKNTTRTPYHHRRSRFSINIKDIIHYNMMLLGPTGSLRKICNAHLVSCKSHKKQSKQGFKKRDRQVIQMRCNYRF